MSCDPPIGSLLKKEMRRKWFNPSAVSMTTLLMMLITVSCCYYSVSYHGNTYTIDEAPNKEDTNAVVEKPYNVALKASARTLGGGVRKVAKGRGKKSASM